MEPGTLLSQLSEEFSSLVGDASTRVVQVGATRGRPATGTLFAAERVLAPAHAIDHEREVKVRDASGTVLTAQHLGADATTDLAVLHVPGLGGDPLRPATEARLGQLAMSLGRSWSAALVASAGIVSVIGGPLRTARGRSLEQVLRADVRVHPLGAGGPLVDSAGAVLGIATGGFMRGLPLFIPAAIAWRTGESIVAHGGVKRGYLGLSAQPVRLPEALGAERRQQVGLLVFGVADASPAAGAGVLMGDVVVGFDGQAIEDHDGLLALLNGERVGKSLPLEIIRAGQLRTVNVTVGERR